MGYLLEGLTNYLILFIPFIVLEFFIYRLYKKQGIKPGIGFLIGWQLFACLMAVILSITGAAGIHEIGKYGSLIRVEDISLIPFRWGADSLFGLIMNAVLFIPVGTAVPMLWDGSGLKETVIAGGSFSLLIECSQLFNIRATDIDDLLMNTLGTVLGYGIYRLLFRRCNVFRIGGSEQKTIVRYGGLLTIGCVFALYFFVGKPIVSYAWECIISMMM